MTAQHTRKSASPGQYSRQESSEGIFFVAEPTDLEESLYALRISTLMPVRTKKSEMSFSFGGGSSNTTGLF